MNALHDNSVFTKLKMLAYMANYLISCSRNQAFFWVKKTVHNLHLHCVSPHYMEASPGCYQVRVTAPLSCSPFGFTLLQPKLLSIYTKVVLILQALSLGNFKKRKHVLFEAYAKQLNSVMLERTV